MEKKELLEKEQEQINSLLDKGVDFTIPTKGFLERLRYGKERTFSIHELCYGALDLISAELIHIQLDEDSLEKNPIAESNKIIQEAAKIECKIIAIAILNKNCAIQVGGHYTINYKRINRLAKYLLWRMQPSMRYKLSLIIRQLMNAGDFINSIRLTSGTIKRTTEPPASLVE